MTLDPQNLRLEDARLYLGTHARALTPYGAVEYLSAKAEKLPEIYKLRLKIMLECMTIYRFVFPKEYARSGSPHFSFQREHELYRLIHHKLFPLQYDHGFDLEVDIARTPNFFLPAIPVSGRQRHDWLTEGLNFERIGPAFALATALSRRVEGAWDQLVGHYKLADCPTPAAALHSVGWTLFVYSCSVEETPLRWLPTVFDMMGYDTGNPWLDLPPGALAVREWSLQEVMNLHVFKADAEDQALAVTFLAGYLNQDPKPRIKRAVEIWNAASLKAEQSGLHELCFDHESGEFQIHDH
jgi:hypothetical protein